MPRPRPPTQQRAPQRAGEGYPGRRGGARPRDSGWSRGGDGADWWGSPPERAAGRPRSPLHLPPLSPSATVAQRAARNRELLRSVLLPPLRPAAPRPAPARPERASPRAARADSLGAALGGLLPPRFREFLHHLRQLSESAEPSPPPTPPDYLRRRAAADHCVQRCPRCACLFLPDSRDQSPHLQNRFRKILLHPVPTVCSFKEQSEFNTVKQSPQPRCPPAPHLKAVLSQSSSSGQSSGSSRRSRPYRVRFADETLGDSALRYWERSCAAAVPSAQVPLPTSEALLGVPGSRGQTGVLRRDQNPDGRTASPPAWLRQNLTRWLDELPGAQRPRGADSWSAQELSGGTHGTSLPPLSPRAAPQSPRGSPRTPLRSRRLLDPLDKLDSFLPSLVLNTLLK